VRSLSPTDRHDKILADHRDGRLEVSAPWRLFDSALDTLHGSLPAQV
jgi:hypothetical protein